MKPGDLVQITRRSIGVPDGTIGLVIGTRMSEDGIKYHTVLSFINDRMRRRRWLEQDLEVLT